MFSESRVLSDLFEQQRRPPTLADLHNELDAARARGHKVGPIDATAVITTEQARLALRDLGIGVDSPFFQVMETVRFFPLGRTHELDTLDQICRHAKDSAWDDDYPGFSVKFLELSSPEGGGYLYEKATGAVHDVGWEDMDALVAGELSPKWASYQAFLEWYYQ